MSVECTKIIVVLGMHRSGTSVITRALETLGVNLGSNLMPPAQGNNEKGFFEDLDIHKFNSDLLVELGSEWDHLEPLPSDLLAVDKLSGHLDDATDLLKKKVQGTSVFAFKDPQTALLLPFWQKVFARLAVDVHYLICLRNPLSVSASLRARDGIDPTRGYLLWAKYQLEALRHTQDCSRLMVSYDSVMEQPLAQLHRIAKAFGLPVPEEDPQGLASFCQDFLTTELRHSHYDEEHLADSSQVLPCIHALYVQFHQAANGLADLDSAETHARLVQLEEALIELQPLSRSIDLLDRARLQLSGEIEAAESKRLEAIKIQSMFDQLLREKQSLSKALEALRREIAEVYTSQSWRVTRPLRALRRHYRNPLVLMKKLVTSSARLLWERLPISVPQKQRLKGLVFSYGRVLFSKTQVYRNWKWINSQYSGTSLAGRGGSFALIDEPVQSVRLLSNARPVETPARLIAFYLPQFHVIEENNQWWGEGFTEWTNVKPAQPLYDGHYQPHIPGDLGYYDLTDVEVQRQQVELAKLYGVGGFCFYFYWFAGKRLLETPLENYLQTSSLDLPFCLCWANENWSRRWDGLDNHILIGQEHSVDDDLAFIAYVAKYMRDERYIRIHGKPLLLVYRPSLLPDAMSTAQRWRAWCRESGIGEIYLAYTQSFDIVDPAIYGFDAAIEFPPNATQPPLVTDQVKPLNDDFTGQVFDWSVYLNRSAQYVEPPYKLYRGVCPAWDNTARRKNRSTSFINSSPRGYQECLYNVIRNTAQGHEQEDERLVFINAWNEWAEGAHLEPDQRYGYAYLEATRMASLRAGLSLRAGHEPVERKLAVIIHAFYPDVFQEILDALEQVRGLKLKLFISCPVECAQTIGSMLEACHHEFELVPLANRGRDVLPFLKILPQVIDGGFDYLLKVHTKKSTHRSDGDVWRRELYAKLLSEQAMDESLEAFAEEPSIGVLGPDGHLVPMSYYWGSNVSAVEKLACRLGIRPSEIADLKFVAGTMFFAQTRALEPLLGLALGEEDFEVEAGQVDGTFAHALERTISISALAAGFCVRSKTEAPAHTEYAFADARA